jgi:hypothetical protein
VGLESNRFAVEEEDGGRRKIQETNDGRRITAHWVRNTKSAGDVAVRPKIAEYCV